MLEAAFFLAQKSLVVRKVERSDSRPKPCSQQENNRRLELTHESSLFKKMIFEQAADYR